MDAGKGRLVKACTPSVQDKMIIDNIMLRFRPIAPRPVTGDSSYEHRKPEDNKGSGNKARTKRKYVRVKKRKRNNEPNTRKNSDEVNKRGGVGPNKTATTDLALARGSCCGSKTNIIDCAVAADRVKEKREPPLLFSFKMDQLSAIDLKGMVVAVETWVTMESVTVTCVEAEGGLGGTDVDKVRSLERDTCPGFISDALNSVLWVNEAYKAMVKVRQENEKQQQEEVMVWLVIEDKFLPFLDKHSAFACWVRLQYHTCRLKGKVSRMVPCDVWRMDFGGLAWRLDLKAALSLGL